VIRYSPPRYKNCRGGKNNLPDAALPDNADNRTTAADYLDLQHAKQKAYRLLSLRPHSSKEIETKLREKRFPAAVINEALEKLHELKYLDDVSFASQWARHLAVNNLWGNRKISAALQTKGIPVGLIGPSIELARSEMPEEEAIALLIRKKMAGKKYGLQDIKEKKRIFQSLLGRGFPAGLILNKLGKLPEEDIHDENGQ
jgi:regulatory protein